MEKVKQTDLIEEVLRKFICDGNLHCPYVRDWCNGDCLGCIMAEMKSAIVIL